MAREPMWRRYARWWGPSARDDVDAELQLHLDLLTDDYAARGHTPEEARALARQRLGDLTRVRTICVAEDQQWEQLKVRRSMWNQLAQDLRLAFRLLVRTPSTSVLAVATMALAIGATTTIFSVVHGVLIRPLPYPAADRLVQARLNVSFQTGTVAISAADFSAWRAQRQSFEHVAVYSVSSFNLTGAGTPESVTGAWTSARLFDVLGTAAALGRSFLPDDDRPEAEPLAMLSDAFWRRRFGGDPGVIGQSISLTGTPSTIIGVLPAGFSFPQADVDVWRNLRIDPQRRGPFFLTGVGRLAPEVTLEQAREEMRIVADHIGRQYPGPDDWSFELQPLHEATVGSVRHVLWLLFGAVAVLLLLAVVNVANLLLARAAARDHEMGIRAALGAGRTRLIRQLLTESVVLAAFGGALGVGLAFAGTRAIVALSADRLPRSADITVDARVLAFSAAIALAAGLLFGLAPALQALRRDVVHGLQAGRRTGTSNPGHRRQQAALVVIQIALAMVLMVSAALLTRSMINLTRHDPGFRADGLLTFYIDLPSIRYQPDALVTGFYDQLLAALRALPGVQGASTSVSLPPHVLTVSDNFVIEGQPVPPGQTPPAGPLVIVSEDYFQTLGVPLLRGRVFTSSDRSDTERVAIVSRTLAQRYFGDTDPVGRRLRMGPDRPNWPWLTIVGVVGDVPYAGLDSDPQTAYYVPAAQNAWGDYYVVIRTATDPASIASAARAAVWSIDPALPVGEMRTMNELVRASIGTHAFRTTLVSLFGVLGFVLAGVGIYGVVAYAVSQRMQELGIRLALGARPGQILRLVLGSGIRLAAAGLVLGLGAALVAARALSGLLFEIGPTDPVTLAAVAGLVLMMALAASFLPAWRAMRVDPVAALRRE